MNKYDTFSARVKAKILDLFIIIPVGLCFFGFVFLFSELDFLHTPQLQKFVLILPLIALFLYPIVMHTIYGQTFGKMAANVKVVDISEKPILFGQAVLRNIPQIAFLILILIYVYQDETDEYGLSASFFGYFFSFYLLFRMTDYICGIVISKNRTLHDLLGKTVVIRTDV